MIDPASLAASAVGVLVTYLGKAAKAAAEDVSTAIGNKITSWLKAKLEGSAAQEALAEVEANPEDEDSQTMLRGALAKRLRGDHSLAGELAELLKEAEKAGYSVKQEMHISGQGNVGAQVAGAKNVVKVGRTD